MKQTMTEARFFRNGYKAMRRAIMSKMVEALKEVDDNELELDDDRGSLVYGGDDQESQIIMSVYLKYAKDAEGELGKVIAKIGVYEEDFQVPLDDMDIEMVLNIYTAFENAWNESIK